MVDLADLASRRAELARIASRHRARNLRVIGSVARGTADNNSDLDLLVDFDQGRSLLDWAALSDDFEALLAVSVDIATENSLKSRNRDEILAQAVPL